LGDLPIFLSKDESVIPWRAKGSELKDSLLKRSLAQAPEETGLDLADWKPLWHLSNKVVFPDEARVRNANAWGKGSPSLPVHARFNDMDSALALT
jgi:hypothetical protein